MYRKKQGKQMQFSSYNTGNGDFFGAGWVTRSFAFQILYNGVIFVHIEGKGKRKENLFNKK